MHSLQEGHAAQHFQHRAEIMLVNDQVAEAVKRGHCKHRGAPQHKHLYISCQVLCKFIRGWGPRGRLHQDHSFLGLL